MVKFIPPKIALDRVYENIKDTFIGLDLAHACGDGTVMTEYRYENGELKSRNVCLICYNENCKCKFKGEGDE